MTDLLDARAPGTEAAEEAGYARPHRVRLGTRLADTLGPVGETLGRIYRSPARPAMAGRFVLGVAAFIVLDYIRFHPSLSEFLQGLSIGSLYGVIAVGIILIYRTARIINFAAAAIGAVPAITALLLDVQRHIPYLIVLPIALLGGPLFGAVIDVLILGRFAQAPRLILTVVTIGVAQGMAALGFFIPVWIGARAGEIPNVPTPWDRMKILNGRGQPLLTGNEVAAVVTVVAIAVALGLFLRYTRIGVALRAAAENADRASLLGIPVKRIQTVAWALAGLLGAMAIFVQAPLIGVPNNATLGFDSLLYAMAAAVVARMERIGVALASGMAVGIIEFGVVSRTGKSEEATAYMLVIILAALLLQRRSMQRAYDAGTSTWEAVKQFRPIPFELRATKEVNGARAALYGLFAAVAVLVPFLVHRGDLPNLQTLPIFGMVGVSLVVLTGWAGQVSLGQFGLVGAGAAAAGGLVANHNIDFFTACAIGVAAGVAAAVFIGLPAVRIQGLYLAVTTLAFGYAMKSYVLNKNYFFKFLLPKGLSAHLARPMLYGRINLDNERTFYFVCLIGLVLAMLAATAFRRNRSGRVLIAARDNQRAAPAYSINLTRTRLAAFAVSGGIAGLAGVLLAYEQHNVIAGTYDPLQSIVVFLSAVIGGLTSVPWAVSGVVGLQAFTVFGARFYQHLGNTISAVMPLLLTGPLLVLNLYFYPGGSAENGFAQRDRFLRWIARRHDILVPSLVADKRVEAEAQRVEAIVAAETHVEEVGSFDLQLSPTIRCPACGLELKVNDAAAHEHFKVGAEV